MATSDLSGRHDQNQLRLDRFKNHSGMERNSSAADEPLLETLSNVGLGLLVLARIP
jgi:hypothetical protein